VTAIRCPHDRERLAWGRGSIGVTYEERIKLKTRIDQALRSRANLLPPYHEQTEAERREYLRIKKQESRRRQRERSDVSA
jgi:hypothetical protein